MRGRRRQDGQSLVLAAIMMAVLVGFTGLAIDGGETTARQQLARAAADGASLAAAYAIAVGGETEAGATTDGQEVLSADGLPTADLTLSFLDSTGAVTTTPSLVATVRAVVADSSGTYFLGAVGIRTIRVTASADASTTTTSSGGGNTGGTASICSICLMKNSGTDLTTGSGTDLTLTGPLQVNSSSAPAVTLGNNTAIAASQTVIATGGTVSYGPNATITPGATPGAAVADPYAALAVPSLSGASSSYTAPAGVSSRSAGIYSTISVPSGATLRLNPGTYVVTGSLTVGGGTLNGSGVTIYLACSAYPTPCPSGGTGALVSVSSRSSVNLSAPTSGTYAGMTVFADRNNTATSQMSGSKGTTLSVSGTWYSLAMPFLDTHASDTMTFGQFVVATLSLANNDVVNFAGPTASGNAVVGLSS